MTYYTPDNTEFVYAVIYKWTNKLNGKSYIGQTINEEERKNQSEKIKGRMAGDKNPMYRSVWTQRQKDSNYRKVLKYDLYGNFIEEFDSMNDAAKSVNKTNTGNISNCCAGKRNKAYGFIWKYKE